MYEACETQQNVIYVYFFIKYKTVWKVCETCKILWELGSRWAKYLTAWDMAGMQMENWWLFGWKTMKFKNNSL